MNSKETHKNVNELENGCSCQKTNAIQSENSREKISSSQKDHVLQNEKARHKNNASQNEKDCQNENVRQNINVSQNTSTSQNQEPFQVPETLRGKTFLDPTYDSSFKELFSDKKILIHFLNGILHLEGETAITDIEYRDPAYGFGLPYSKMVRFDVRAMLSVSAKMDLDQGFLYKFF